MKAQEGKINAFQHLAEASWKRLEPSETLNLSLSSEDQTYVRLNQGKVRHLTKVHQQKLRLTFTREGRCVRFQTDLLLDIEQDLSLLEGLIERARLECCLLPEDPYLSPLESHENSSEHHAGELPKIEDFCEMVFDLTRKEDLAGLYAGGDQLQISANSGLGFHQFSTRNFFFDYSLYTQNLEGDHKAVKDLYADHCFSKTAFALNLSRSIEKLHPLKARSKKIHPGTYRVYLAPRAVADLIGMFSWGGLSLSAVRRGESAFSALESGKRSLSPSFSLREDFSLGLHPRFNEEGQLAPRELPIFENGHLQNLLVNDRSAIEYGVPSNGASKREGLRSPRMAAGSLEERKILETLGTGLYLGNLHYLNWSDRQSARVTGMTRYACFWVENGTFVAPISDLRFDESLFHIFGEGLEAVGEKTLLLPETSTYQERQLGGMEVPGLLVDGFRFTL